MNLYLMDDTQLESSRDHYLKTVARLAMDKHVRGRELSFTEAVQFGIALDKFPELVTEYAINVGVKKIIGG